VDLEVKLIVWFGLATLSAPAAELAIPYVYTETKDYSQEPVRFPGGAAIQIVRNGRKSALFPTFAASSDAAISFDGRRIVFAGRQRAQDPWQIWEGPVGGPPVRIVQEGDAIAPFYLPGGKIVYSRRIAGGFQIEVTALDTRLAHRLTFAPGNFVVCGVLRDGRILFEGRHPAGGAGRRDLYTIYSDGSGVETYRCDHGKDRGAGRELASGDILFEAGRRLAKFVSARAGEQAFEQPDGEFAGPVAEIAAGDLLVSYRPNPSLPFSLYRWRQLPAKLEKLQGNAYQSALVRPHEIPRRHPSALGDRDGANLLCLNVYETREAIRPASVAAVRVWTQDGAGATVELGRAPVAADGSFFVQVPEDRPIRFELLDRNGKTEAAEHGWFWARRGEQRICVGCHAGPARAAENLVPGVLEHNPEPVQLKMPAPHRSSN